MGKWESLKNLLMILCLLVLLPILLPWTMISSSLDDRRKRGIAEQTRCVCGTILGTAALKLNSEAWAARVAEAEARFPGSRIHYRHVHDAICVNCGQWYLYEPKLGRFAPVAQTEAI